LPPPCAVQEGLFEFHWWWAHPHRYSRESVFSGITAVLHNHFFHEQQHSHMLSMQGLHLAEAVQGVVRQNQKLLAYGGVHRFLELDACPGHHGLCHDFRGIHQYWNCQQKGQGALGPVLCVRTYGADIRGIAPQFLQQIAVGHHCFHVGGPSTQSCVAELETGQGLLHGPQRAVISQYRFLEGLRLLFLRLL